MDRAVYGSGNLLRCQGCLYKSKTYELPKLGRILLTTRHSWNAFNHNTKSNFGYLLSQVYHLVRLVGPTDELHPFTKSSEIGLDLTTDSTALLSGMNEVSIFVRKNV